VAGHKRAFGADTVPCSYQDLELADLILLVGSNAAWCHPVLFQRIRAAKKQRPQMRVVVIDPRRTPTCDIADLHLPLRAGSDVSLFNGLLHYLEREDQLDWRYIVNHTEGFSQTIENARCTGDPVLQTAGRCALDVDAVRQFFELFAATRKTVSVYSQGVNQWSFGTDKVNAIINCHLATGRIGEPGMGPFSFTGQPNAMGGREVGGLANQLAAHMDFSPEHQDRVRRFWKAPRLAGKEGLKAVDLFQAVGKGKVKAIWIMATNPVVSLPEADAVSAALAACELVVVSDCVRHTDTNQYADILLPAAAWGEKEGSVTNSERCISRQRAFLPQAGNAKPDWWILSQVAQRMGFEGFDYCSASAIFREHAALSGFENQGQRDFDISLFEDLDESGYAALQPVQWPVNKARRNGAERLFENAQFYTANKLARFTPVREREPAQATDAQYPLVLNTGRTRDHWHTMTRTGGSPRLSGHAPEPYVEIAPPDARKLGIEDGQLACASTRQGKVVMRARVSDSQQVGDIFIPMHWNAQFASQARVGALVNRNADPISGQPEFKHTPARLCAYPASWHGFIMSRAPLALAQADYWAASRRKALWHYEIAGLETLEDWSIDARQWLGGDGDAQWSEYKDSSGDSYRAARFVDGQLQALVFIGSGHQLPPRDWLMRLFQQAQLSAAERSRVLAGRPSDAAQDEGPIVCSCLGVGRQRLLRAIKEQQLNTPEALGEALGAGTNCGSCIPELRALIAEAG
jgi:assimilatory nitrate reductase catalytic subunit